MSSSKDTEVEQGYRRSIVELAHEYVRMGVKFFEPTNSNDWNVREVEPRHLDCSSLVSRICLIVMGGSYTRLGDPSAAAWAGKTATDWAGKVSVDRRALPEVDVPLPGDLVFYSRPSDPANELHRDRAVVYHVAISVGDGKVVEACQICKRVVEHDELCPHGRWTLLERPYRQFPICERLANY